MQAFMKLAGILLAVSLLLSCVPASPPTGHEPEPTPAATRTDSVVEGEGGRKSPDAPPVDDQIPAKDSGAELTPIHVDGGSKVDRELVEIPDPGSVVGEIIKGEPRDVVPGTGPMLPLDEEVAEGSHVRVMIELAQEAARPVWQAQLDGMFVPSSTLDGSLLAVLFYQEEPVYLFSALDPLLEIGLPSEDGQGYSLSEAESGLINVALPERFAAPEVLAGSTLRFYRLDITVPWNTEQSLEQLPTLLRGSTLLAEVSGNAILDAPR